MAAGDISKQWLADCRSRVAQPAANGGTTDDFLYAAMTEACLDLALQLDNALLATLGDSTAISTTLNVNAYALPTDYLRWVGCKYEGIEARWIAPEEDQALIDNLNEVATATRPRWNVADGMLNVYAAAPGTMTASKSIKFRYIANPVAMTASVDPTLPINLKGLVVRYACAAYFEERGDMNKAQYHMGIYQGRLSWMTGRVGPGEAEPFPKVGDAGGR